MYITDKVFLHMVKSAGISVHKGIFTSKNKIYFNQRHISIDCMPDRFRDLPRYGIIRSPEDWYRSFYDFFINTEGYMSFMLNDPLPPDKEGKIFIEPISFNNFIHRSMNIKSTLMKYPNKARVFNNILRSQGNMHFICTYFKEPIDIDTNNNKGKNWESSLDQFDMSLYEWFYANCGMNTSTNIPINKIKDLESIFNIKIDHINKTQNKIAKYDKNLLELIRNTHKKFYNEINNYKGIK